MLATRPPARRSCLANPAFGQRRRDYGVHTTTSTLVPLAVVYIVCAPSYGRGHQGRENPAYQVGNCQESKAESRNISRIFLTMYHLQFPIPCVLNPPPHVGNPFVQ